MSNFSLYQITGAFPQIMEQEEMAPELKEELERELTVLLHEKSQNIIGYTRNIELTIEAMKTEEKPENVAFLPEISIDEFAKVDLRVAKIKNCEPIKKAKKLLKLTLDDGSGNERIVASGIAQYYTPDELIGRNIIVVANLKPAKLCGVESSGMILAADTPDGVKVIFTDDIPEGSKIR